MDNKIYFQRAGILLAFPLAYAYARLILVEMLEGWMFSAALTTVSLIFILVSELVRCGRKSFVNKNTGETVFWYVMMILASVTAPFGPSDALSVFAVHLCAVYSVLVSNDILLGDKTGGFILADLIHGFYVKSFAGFPNFVIDWSAFKREGEKKSRNPAVILLIIGFIFLMGLFFIISLVFISRIDVDIAAAFISYWRSITHYFEKLKIDNIIWSFFLAVPICFYLYGLMARSAKSDGTREKRIGSNMASGLEKGRKVPCVISDLSFREKEQRGPHNARRKDTCYAPYEREHNLCGDLHEQALAVFQHLRLYAQENARHVGNACTGLCSTDVDPYGKPRKITFPSRSFLHGCFLYCGMHTVLGTGLDVKTFKSYSKN